MSKEKISDNSNNTWICPVCGTKNNEKECTICGHEHLNEEVNNIKLVPLPVEKNNNYKKFMIITIIVCFVLLILGGSYKLITEEKETSLENMDKITNEITLSDDKDDDFDQNTGKLARSNLSLDGLDLGDSISDMKNVLGRDYTKKPNGKYMVYKYSDIEVTIEDGKIVALVSDDNKVRTKSGIHTGSDYQSMINEYGKPDYKMNDGNLILYEYEFYSIDNEQGLLSFAVNSITKDIDYISVRIVTQENNKNYVKNEAVEALEGYYAAISRHDMRDAYEYFSEDMKTHMGTLDEYASGYQTTISDKISNVKVISSNEYEIEVAYTLTARDTYQRGVKIQTFDCTALLSKKTGNWHIIDMSAKKQSERIEK